MWDSGRGGAPPLTHPCPQNSSKGRLRCLESLHSFVASATKELMWLNEKEEEEVGFDWSERNTNMTAKKESYSVRASPMWPLRPPPQAHCSGPSKTVSSSQALMRELELKEKKIKEIQSTGDRLLQDNHPARSTVEVETALCWGPVD